eukprot:356330-Chlamydomonas_euryale.AAC.4
MLNAMVADVQLERAYAADACSGSSTCVQQHECRNNTHAFSNKACAAKHVHGSNNMCTAATTCAHQQLILQPHAPAGVRYGANSVRGAEIGAKALQFESCHERRKR